MVLYVGVTTPVSGSQLSRELPFIEAIDACAARARELYESQLSRELPFIEASPGVTATGSDSGVAALSGAALH